MSPFPNEGVEEPDAEEEEVAPQPEHHRTVGLVRCSVHEHHDTGPKEHGEQTHHLVVDEDLAEHADHPVDRRIRSICRQVEVGGSGEPERHTVHQQNPEHGEASERIEVGYAHLWCVRNWIETLCVWKWSRWALRHGPCPQRA